MTVLLLPRSSLRYLSNWIYPAAQYSRTAHQNGSDECLPGWTWLGQILKDLHYWNLENHFSVSW